MDDTVPQNGQQNNLRPVTVQGTIHPIELRPVIEELSVRLKDLGVMHVDTSLLVFYVNMEVEVIVYNQDREVFSNLLKDAHGKEFFTRLGLVTDVAVGLAEFVTSETTLRITKAFGGHIWPSDDIYVSDVSSTVKVLYRK